MIKVLAFSYLFPNKYQPFYGIFVLNRLKAVKKYCTVQVIAPVPWFPFMAIFNRFRDYPKIPRKETIEGIDVLHPRFFIIPRYLKWIDGISYLFSTILFMLRLKKDYNFDLIDVHWIYPDILAAYIYAKIYKKKLLVTIRGKRAVYFGEKSLRKKIIDFLLKKVDYIITLSKELKDIVIDIGAQATKVKVILNGVDIDRFKPIKRDECRKRLGLPLDKKILLSVGSLIITKGFHRIIEVLPEISKRYEPDFYIIGDAGPAGDFRKEIEDKIRELNLKNVFLLGSKSNEELVYWYNACDIFCLATSAEGSPNVVMEALACGTPVLVSAVGGIPDIVKENFLGFLIDPDSSTDLKSKLETALKIDWDRNRIRKYMEKFTWDQCAKQVIDIYKEALSK